MTPRVLDPSLTQPAVPRRDGTILDCRRGPGGVSVRCLPAARLLGPAAVSVHEDQGHFLPRERPAAAPERGRPGLAGVRQQALTGRASPFKSGPADVTRGAFLEGDTLLRARVPWAQLQEAKPSL